MRCADFWPMPGRRLNSVDEAGQRFGEIGHR
jgi:hypothetical protein